MATTTTFNFQNSTKRTLTLSSSTLTEGSWDTQLPGALNPGQSGDASASGNTTNGLKGAVTYTDETTSQSITIKFTSPIEGKNEVSDSSTMDDVIVSMESNDTAPMLDLKVVFIGV
ncbi:hypothetical protein FRC04_007452 [Tulasnella sp. 424]|nr:hypothetical protein FRC04_007452 [Tulasnella sp. 424]KAG8975146.1 hypothetical protein FRC05_006314 [Tulasnella sp. 425]